MNKQFCAAFLVLCGILSLGVQNVQAANRAPAPAEAPFFYIWLDYEGDVWDVQAYSWNSGDELTLTIDDPGTPAPVDHQFTQMADGSGYALFGLEQFDIPRGSRFTLINAPYTTTATHTLTNLWVTEVNPFADTLTGTASPGSIVQVTIEGDYLRQVTVESGGNWKVDYGSSGIDIVRGDKLYISQDGGTGGTTAYGWDVVVPWFYVWLGRDGTVRDLHTYGFLPGNVVTLVIRDPGLPGGVYTDAAVVGNADFDPNVAWFDLAGLDLSSGADIEIASRSMTLDHTLSRFRVNPVNTALNTVGGSAEPGVKLLVGVDGEAYRRVISDGAGRWLADFSQPGLEPDETVLDLHPGMQLGIAVHNGEGATGMNFPITTLRWLPLTLIVPE